MEISIKKPDRNDQNDSVEHRERSTNEIGFRNFIPGTFAAYEFVLKHIRWTHSAFRYVIQPDDHQNCIELLSMPQEILENILIHFEDKDLLMASHVCKSFAAAAEVAFARKYSKEQYEIWLDSGELHGYHRAILTKYGGKIKRVGVFYVQDTQQWILELIEEKCPNVEDIVMTSIPRIINLKGLKHVQMQIIPNISKQQFISFIENNRQMENLWICTNRSTELIETLHNRLPMIKTLSIQVGSDGITNISQIELHSLQSLYLSLSNQNNYERILRAIESENLKELDLSISDPVNNEFIDQIIKFKALTSIQMTSCPVTMHQITVLARNLPQLTHFNIGIIQDDIEMVEETEDMIFSVLSMFPNLKTLEFYFKHNFGFIRAKTNTQSMDEFYSRLIERYANVEVNVKSYNGVLSASKDRIYTRNREHLKLRWMENFNEKRIQSTLKDISHFIHDLEFINNCPNNVDVSVFSLNDWHRDLRTLKIKSEGSISINRNITSRRDPSRIAFGKLKEIEIELENHTAIDFLRDLDPDICKQIEKLCLKTGMVNEYEKDEYEIEMDQILSKFKNLKTIE